MDEWKDELFSGPPRCIEGFLKTAVAVERIGGHGESISRGFQLRCPCGGGVFLVHGFTTPELGGEDDPFVGPISLECTACGKVTQAIDTDVHGYDAEYGFACPFEDKSESLFGCEPCRTLPMEVAAFFYYSEDLWDTPDEEIRGRQQDYFTWTFLEGRCAQCGALLAILDWECA